MGTVKEELPLCSPKVVNLYELALLPLTFLLSLPDPQFPKGLLTVTQQGLRSRVWNSLRSCHLIHLCLGVALAFCFCLVISTSSQAMSRLNHRHFSFRRPCTCGADSGDFWGCRIEAAAYTMQLTSQGVLGFTPCIHWLITARCLPSTRTPGHLVLLLPLKLVSLNSRR